MHRTNLSFKDLAILTTKGAGSQLTLLDLEILCCEVLQISRAFLKSHAADLISPDKIAAILNLVARRAAGEPIAYILGRKEFWDLELTVNPKVLIPRSDTELLVEQVLALLPLKSSAKILELGTGSGAIAIAIAKHRPMVEIIASDLSLAALDLAQANLRKFAIDNIELICSDWFTAFNNCTYKFDVILSNPPYIGEHELELCDREIFFEPEIALFAAAKGFAAIKQIIKQSKDHLIPGGKLFLEHGRDQLAEIRCELQAAGFINISSFVDLSSIPRVVCAQAK